MLKYEGFSLNGSLCSIVGYGNSRKTLRNLLFYWLSNDYLEKVQFEQLSSVYCCYLHLFAPQLRMKFWCFTMLLSFFFPPIGT